MDEFRDGAIADCRTTSFRNSCAAHRSLSGRRPGWRNSTAEDGPDRRSRPPYPTTSNRPNPNSDVMHSSGRVTPAAIQGACAWIAATQASHVIPPPWRDPTLRTHVRSYFNPSNTAQGQFVIEHSAQFLQPRIDARPAAPTCGSITRAQWGVRSRLTWRHSSTPPWRTVPGSPRHAGQRAIRRRWRDSHRTCVVRGLVMSTESQGGCCMSALRRFRR